MHTQESITKSPRKEAVIAICLSPDKKEVLLVRRRDMPVWVPPGGGIEAGETPEEAACREMQEESGYRVTISRKVGEYCPQNRLTAYTHVFLCRIIGGKAHCSAESSAVQFFQLSQLPKPMAPPHLEWIRDALIDGPPIFRPITSVTYGLLVRSLFLYPNITLRFLLAKIGLHFND